MKTVKNEEYLRNIEDENVKDGTVPLRDAQFGNVSVGSVQYGDLVDHDFFSEIIRAIS